MNPVLVASDSAADPDVVRRLLKQEGLESEKILVPRSFVADFCRWRSQMLMLAFKAPAAAERHCLGSVVSP